MSIFTLQPASPESYRLLHEGCIALGRAEAHGMRIDTAKLAANQKEARAEIADIDAWMRTQPEFTLQRRRFGVDSNPMSREQLAYVLFGDMGLPYEGARGAKGQYLLDEERLEDIDSQYARTMSRRAKLEKALSTYLDGLEKEVVYGRVHPFFNLHKIITFRSSCDSPNLQNQPIREEWLARLIRTVFVPDEDQVLVEIDFSGAEVIVAACYHQDPTMIEYLNSGFDLHSAMAAEIWRLPGKPPKPVRQEAKGKFVFAEFYGDYYKQVGANLWKSTVELGLQDHLQTVGIRGREAFIEHIKEVERKFWKQRFPVYDQWRERWWRSYTQRGVCYTHTGFRVWGNHFSRNQIINNPIQGSAFHCLLKSMIEIDRRTRERGMGARCIGQVHDSLLATVPRREVADFTALADEVMTRWLASKWPWLIIPMKIEIEASHENWFSKKPLAVGVEYV